MVVGSLDAWLAASKGDASSQQGIPIPMPKQHVTAGSHKKQQASSSRGLASSPKAQNCIPFQAHPLACTASPAPRLSLLTSQLRDSCGSPVDDHWQMAAVAESGQVVQDESVFLPRAVSQPELHQGNTVSLMACNALSSPYHRRGNAVAGCGLAAEAAKQGPHRSSLPPASPFQPRGQGQLVRSITLDVQLPADAFSPAIAISAATATPGAAAPDASAPTLLGPPLQSVDKTLPSIPSEAAGSAPSRRRNVFDGTVRGGQPRKAGWCSGEGNRDSRAREAAPSTSATGCCGAPQPLAQQALRPQGWSQPQSLRDMLRSALNRY